ncbi:MAG: hypothetical protein QF682_13250 [Candidatus Thermoplasmatota archaeon]|nr:hypothetical protein [Candidatus Thermoplasmatota archaeon]
MYPLDEPTVILNGTIYDSYTGEKLNDSLNIYGYYNNYTYVNIKVEGGDYCYFKSVSLLNGSYEVLLHEGKISLYAAKVIYGKYFGQTSRIISFNVEPGESFKQDIVMTKNHVVEIDILYPQIEEPYFWVYRHYEGLHGFFYSSTYEEYNEQGNLIYNYSANTQGLVITNGTYFRYVKLDFQPGLYQRVVVNFSEERKFNYQLRGRVMGIDRRSGLKGIKIDYSIIPSEASQGGFLYTDEEGYYLLNFTSPQKCIISIEPMHLVGSDEFGNLIREPEDFDYSISRNPSRLTTIYGVNPNWNEIDRFLYKYKRPGKNSIKGNRIVINSFLARALNVSVGDTIDYAQTYFFNQDESARIASFENYRNYWETDLLLDIIVMTVELEIGDIIDLDLEITDDSSNFGGPKGTMRFLSGEGVNQYSNIILMDLDFIDIFINALSFDLEQYMDANEISIDAFWDSNVSLGTS